MAKKEEEKLVLRASKAEQHRALVVVEDEGGDEAAWVALEVMEERGGEGLREPQASEVAWEEMEEEKGVL